MPAVNLPANHSAREMYARGLSLLEGGAIREAEAAFRQALALSPDFPDALLCLGHCLHLRSAYDEALALYDRLVTGEPGSVAGWNNRGNTLLAISRFDDAIQSYRQALTLIPSLHDARVALATCYQAVGKYILALAECETVLRAVPDHAEAHWNKSLLLLLAGDYHNGWREYEWRWRKRDFTSPRRDFPQPQWQGENPVGKRVLIHAEQGFGDTLQFCRYVTLVAALGAEVVFECHPPLAPLMETLHERLHVIPMGLPLPPFDLHVPLLSLPLLFGTTVETVPARTPYLSTPPGRLPLWQTLVPQSNTLKVGICWAGKAYPDPRRSCSPEYFAPLAAIPGMSLYSLQVGWDSHNHPPDFFRDSTPHLHDFADTAALISRLDLIISVDTAVAHLAGALGKQTFVLLPFVPDWRWLLDRPDSPWYPTMRLFRQTARQSWDEVIRQVTAEIAGLAANRQVPL